MKNNKTFQFFYKFYFLLKDFRIRVFIFFILSLFTALIELLSLSSLIPVVNFVFDKKKFSIFKDKYFMSELSFDQAITFFLFFIVFIFFIKFLIFIFLNKFSNNLIRDCSTKLTNNLFTNYLDQDYTYHINKNSMEIVNFIQEIDSVCRVVLKASLNIFVNSIILFSVLILLFNINFNITLYFITFITLVSLIIFFSFKNKLIEISKVIFQSSKKKLLYLGDNFRSIKEIKINHLNTFVSNNFFKVNKNHFNSAAKRDIIKTYPKIFFEYIFILLIVFLIFIIKDDSNSLESFGITVSFFLIASVRCIPMISAILSNSQVLKAKKYSVDIVYNEFLDLNTKKKNSKDVYKDEKISFKKSIELQNINFGYKDKLILEGVNLKVQKGSFIGLSGDSGMGKSTLLNILSGLLKYSSGNILIDGNKKDFFSKMNWCDKISYVSQNVYLNDDTIINNIILGDTKKTVNKQVIIDILKMVNLYNFVTNLPDDLDTIIGEGGSKLSGGQIQRLGLARAIYKNSEIFILDEPTNSLDVNNESNIINLLKTFKGKKTIIMSSHKIDNFELCDKIFSIKNKKLFQIK